MPDDPDGLIKLDVLLEQKRKQKSDLEVEVAGGTAARNARFRPLVNASRR